MSDERRPTALGCLGAILGLFVVVPIFYILVVWMLWRCEAPYWIWAFYWIYVPAGIVCHLMGEFQRLFSDD